MKLGRLYWILKEQVGVDVKKLFSIYRFFFFYRDLNLFKKSSKNEIIELMPCLHDRFDASGSIEDEYFWQDLFVAQCIYNKNPVKHFDVGSRLDGFVAHVASFRHLDVFDIRPLNKKIPNVNFLQCDITDLENKYYNITDSLSCLHTFEHFGLGRYGDKIDSEAPQLALRNLVNLLKDDGFFYISTPIGRKRVLFNAHRISSFSEFLSSAKKLNLTLIDLAYKVPGKDFVTNVSIDEKSLIDTFSDIEYSLVIFIFKKTIKI